MTHGSAQSRLQAAILFVLANEGEPVPEAEAYCCPADDDHSSAAMLLYDLERPTLTKAIVALIEKFRAAVKSQQMDGRQFVHMRELHEDQSTMNAMIDGHAVRFGLVYSFVDQAFRLWIDAYAVTA